MKTTGKLDKRVGGVEEGEVANVEGKGVQEWEREAFARH